MSLSGNSGRLTWVRLQQPQEHRYPVLQVLYGSFRHTLIHRTLTWTTSLTCVRHHSYACVYTRGGRAHRHRVSTHFLTWKNYQKFYLCSWRGSNLGLPRNMKHELCRFCFCVSVGSLCTASKQVRSLKNTRNQLFPSVSQPSQDIAQHTQSKHECLLFSLHVTVCEAETKKKIGTMSAILLYHDSECFELERKW